MDLGFVSLAESWAWMYWGVGSRWGPLEHLFCLCL